MYQNNRVKLILEAIFASGNYVLPANRIMSVYSNYYYHTSSGTIPTKITKLPVSSVAYCYWTSVVLDACKDKLENSSQQMKIYADQYHLESTSFKVRNLVLL
jgi:hypothetical protein